MVSQVLLNFNEELISKGGSAKLSVAVVTGRKADTHWIGINRSRIQLARDYVLGLGEDCWTHHYWHCLPQISRHVSLEQQNVFSSGINITSATCIKIRCEHNSGRGRNDAVYR